MVIEQLYYTDLARGKGFDSSRGGYQIKAASPGLAAHELKFLDSLCSHYGGAVYGGEEAVAAAKNQELEWRKTTDELESPPASILELFPVVVSYDRLDRDRYALTRVCYTGLTHDRRFGNFFAHSLVLNPSELADYHHNPLVAARSGAMAAEAEDDGVILSEAPDLGKPAERVNPCEVLGQAPFKELFKHMASAIRDASRGGAPMLLCLDDWREAPKVIEALLELFPPSFRSQITFTTYENDRNWRPFAEGPTEKEEVAPHHVIAVCVPEGGALGLRQRELNSTFAVFNFVEGQFSDVLGRGPFLNLVANLVGGERLEALRSFLDLIEHLGLGLDPRSWDALVPAAALFDREASAKSLAEAGLVLSEKADTPAEARDSLALLLPVIRRLHASGDWSGLAEMGPRVGDLLDLAREEAGEDLEQEPFLPEMRNLAVTGAGSGQWRMVEGVLRCCGRERDAVLLGLLERMLEDGTDGIPASDLAETRELIDFLIEGIDLVQEREEGTDFRTALFFRLFRAAEKVGLVADVWRRVGRSELGPYLVAAWDPGKKALAEALIAAMPVKVCSDGNAFLSLLLLEKEGADADGLFKELERVVDFTGGLEERKRHLKGVLRVADQRISGLIERAVVIGRLVDIAADTEGESFLLGGFEDLFGQVDSVSREQICGRLLAAGASRVMGRKVLEALIPWDEHASAVAFAALWKDVLEPHAVVRYELCHLTAAELDNGGSDRGVLPLAMALAAQELILAPDEQATPAAVRLLDAVALALPFGPLPDSWAFTFEEFSVGLPEAAEARIKILRLIRAVEIKRKKDDWSLEKSPLEPGSLRGVGLLDATEKEIMRQWLFDLFKSSGVCGPSEARLLVEFFREVGAATGVEIAQEVAQLLHGRDSVTRVVAAIAFVRAGIEDQDRKYDWGSAVGAIVDAFEDDERRLFMAHLEKRFHPESRRYDEQLRWVCQNGRINPPEPAPPSGWPPKPKSSRGAADPATTSPPPAATDKVKRAFRRFWGGKGEQAKAPTSGKKK